MPFFLAICFLIHPWIGFLSLAGGIILMALTIQTERASRGRPRGRPTKAAAARRHGRSRPPQHRHGHRDGMAGALARALGQGQRPLPRRGRPLQRRRQFLRQHHEGAAAADAVGDPRPRRLSGDPAGAERRRHDRRLDHDGTRAGADRDRDRQLARLRRRARQHPAAVGDARADAGAIAAAHRPAEADRAAFESRAVTVAAPGAQVSRSWPTSTSASRPARCSASSGRTAPARLRWSRVLVGDLAAGARHRSASTARRSSNGTPDALGRHLGYMSQTVELFDGTVAENIARMAPEPDARRGAARRAGRRRARHDPAAAGRLRHADRRRRRRSCRSGSGSASRSPARSTAILPGRARRAERQSRRRRRSRPAERRSSSCKLRGAIVIVVAHRRSALARLRQGAGAAQRPAARLRPAR